MQATRRSFIAGSAIAGGIAAMGAATVANAQEAVVEAADLVIVGSGMGGMCCALEALQNGIGRVVIVERSRHTGGGTSWSYGTVHVGSAGDEKDTINEFTHFRSSSDLCYKALGDVPNLVEWLIGNELPVLPSSNGKSGTLCDGEEQTGLKAARYFFDRFVELVESLGGTIMTQTTAVHLVADEAGAVAGVLCHDAEGATFTIPTTQVVLSCGGFQSDQELRQRFLGREAQTSTVLGTPYNTGAGIRLAAELGGIVQGDLSKFAGYFFAAEPARNPMEDAAIYEEGDFGVDAPGKLWLFDTCIDSYPAGSILVNAEGKRYVDENKSGHSSKPATAQQTRATGIVICDNDVWNAWMEASTLGRLTIGQKFEIITSEEIGGAVYEANTIEELADALNASGKAAHSVHKANLVKTVSEYNAAIGAGTEADLDVPRTTGEPVQIVTPPFHAVPIRNAIFATFGGVAVNDKAQVLNQNHEPINGLYATVPCAGGFFNEFYTGSIAHAGVTGRWAADAAAEALGL